MAVRRGSVQGCGVAACDIREAVLTTAAPADLAAPNLTLTSHMLTLDYLAASPVSLRPCAAAESCVAHAMDDKDGDVWERVTVQQASGDAQQCQPATLQTGGCPPGVYTLLYRATDLAGNAAAAETLTVRVVQRGMVTSSVRLGCVPDDTTAGEATVAALLAPHSAPAAALRAAVAAMVAAGEEDVVDESDVVVVSAESEAVAAEDDNGGGGGGTCGVRVHFTVAVTTTGAASTRRRSHRLRSLLATVATGTTTSTSSVADRPAGARPSASLAAVATVAARRLLQDSREDSSRDPSSSSSLSALLTGAASSLATADVGAFLAAAGGGDSLASGAGGVEVPSTTQQTLPVEPTAMARATMEALLADTVASVAAAAAALTAAGFDAAARDVVADAWRSQVLAAWGDGTMGQEQNLVTLAAASQEAATTLDADVTTLVLSLEASQAAATAAAASGEALQRLLDGAMEAAEALGFVPPPPPSLAFPQTPQCAALPQMEDVKYFLDLSPWAPAVDSDSDIDTDSARRHLVRAVVLCGPLFLRAGVHLQLEQTAPRFHPCHCSTRRTLTGTGGGA